jgi:drug/metabolite transporter (DMT)-like permease
MSWLLVTILAYFFLAIVSLFDRYFLVGSIPNPKVYTFYVGVLWLLVCLFLIPFGIVLPVTGLIILGLVTGFIKIFANLFLFKSTAISEVSRAVPAIGGFLPIFSFILFFLYFPKAEILNLSQFIAFILLVLGSVLISLKKFSPKFFTFKTLKYPILSAFLFALAFFLTKILFLRTSFLSGFFLILIGGGLGALSFLIFSQFRKNIFTQKFNQQMSGIFFLGQIIGGIGAILQQYAFFLAKPSQIPLINALEGIIYIFLLFFVFLLSFWRPWLLKEEMRGMTLFQKIIAIFFIVVGLAILTIR